MVNSAGLRKLGFTTAQSYEATPDDMRDMRAASDQGVVSLDLIALPAFDTVDQMLQADPKFPFGAYSKGDRGFKVAGMMVPTDGAPRLRFAWFTKPYADTAGFGKDWRGFAYNPQSTIDRCARLAYEKDIYREEARKGTLAAGMLADLVERDGNPLKVEPDDIRTSRSSGP
jgi:predicted amidohydrolase YtcJ